MATNESVRGFMQPADEKTVMILLKMPALSYLRDLRKTLDANPQYLSVNADGVRTKVTELLLRGGVFWDEDIFDREWERVVREAVIRLRSIER
ncbi:MAG: hypothetical protein HY562_01655 [Ignavibacteriales bacterium]|nr:hypothetical protein [Ignavibacteriales bacterium]